MKSKRRAKEALGHHGSESFRELPPFRTNYGRHSCLYKLDAIGLVGMTDLCSLASSCKKREMREVAATSGWMAR